MSVRACLLCGKPLSRIWSGAGDEFCSREHRNQYRLRRGMDRLHEANKVASVMRRRENPRPIPASRLIRPGQEAARDFAEHAPFRLRPAAPAIRATEASVHCVLPARAPLGPRPCGALLRRQSYKWLAFPLRAHSRPSALPLSMPGASPMPQAAGTLAPALAVPVSAERIEYGFELDCMRSRILRETRRRHATGLSFSPSLAQDSPAHTVALPREGLALRVSMAAAFRLSVFRPPAVTLADPIEGGLEAIFAQVAPGMGASWNPRPRFGPSAPRIGSVGFDPPSPSIPAVPPPARSGAFRWPGIMNISIGFGTPLIRYRTAIVRFGEENPGKERFDEYRN